MKNGKKVRVHVGQRGGLFIMQGGNKKYLSQQGAGKWGNMFAKAKGLAQKASNSGMFAKAQGFAQKASNAVGNLQGAVNQFAPTAPQQQGTTPTPNMLTQMSNKATNFKNKSLQTMGNITGNLKNAVGQIPYNAMGPPAMAT